MFPSFLPKVALAENIVTESTAKSSNANLKNLGINPNDFKGFRANKTSYDITVDDEITDIEVYATTQDAKAELEGTGEYELSEGLNKILVKVIAEDGTEKTYTLNITKNKVSEGEENTVENQIVTNTSNTDTSETKKEENTTDMSSLINTMEEQINKAKKTGYVVVGLVGIISLTAIYFAISSYRNGNYDEYDEEEENDEVVNKPDENYYEEYLNSIEEKRKLEAQSKEEIEKTVNILEDVYNKNKEEVKTEEKNVEIKDQKEEIEKVAKEETKEDQKEDSKDTKIGQEYNFSRRPRGKGKHF